MAESIEKAKKWLQEIERVHSPSEWQKQLQPDTTSPYHARKMDLARNASDVRKQLEGQTNDPDIKRALLNTATEASIEAYLSNIENCIGTVQLPVGIAGPLRIRGSAAQGDYPIPMATHEAALVASYHRGAIAISEAGGCTAVILSEGVSRVPCFTFDRILEATTFLAWVVPQQKRFKEIAESTTSHGKLHEIKITVEGSNVFLHFTYKTADAAGQNMVCGVQLIRRQKGQRHFV
jgi:hydroxymethylglutaryl-CoA reductase (NADPH)